VEFDVQLDDRSRAVARQITTQALPRPWDFVGQRLHGTIRSFQGAWGFIISDRFAGDLFVHRDSFLAQYQGVQITVGTLVEFDVERDQRRKGAKDRLVARRVGILGEVPAMGQVLPQQQPMVGAMQQMMDPYMGQAAGMPTAGMYYPQLPQDQLAYAQAYNPYAQNPYVQQPMMPQQPLPAVQQQVYGQVPYAAQYPLQPQVPSAYLPAAVPPAIEAVQPMVQPPVMAQAPVPAALVPEQPKTEAAGGAGPDGQGLLHITMHDWEPDQPGQLWVTKGTLVNVSYRAAHGWVYASTAQPGESTEPTSEGWIPQAVVKRVSLCRVAMEWPAEGTGTLGVTKGEVIAVSKEAERGWVYGERIGPRQADRPTDGWLPKKVLDYLQS